MQNRAKSSLHQIFIIYFFLINILIKLTFFYFFSDIFLIRNGHSKWSKNLSHRALALVCGSCFTMQTQEKMKKLLQRFNFYFTVDKKGRFILNNYQFSQSFILNFIATFPRITVLHFSIFMKLLKCNFKYPLVHNLY